MDKCFAILDAHGKFDIDTTTSHDDLLLPMGATLVDTVTIAQAEVVVAKQGKVFEEEFATVQATCLAKCARVDSPPPAATPVLLDPKGKSSVDLHLHSDADEKIVNKSCLKRLCSGSSIAELCLHLNNPHHRFIQEGFPSYGGYNPFHQGGMGKRHCHGSSCGGPDDGFALPPQMAKGGNGQVDGREPFNRGGGDGWTGKRHHPEADVLCEELPVEWCAYSISSLGARCVLVEGEKGGDDTMEYNCQTSSMETKVKGGWIEAEECMEACGLTRMTLGLHPSNTPDLLCSSRCSRTCPHLHYLLNPLSADQGSSIADLCLCLNNPHHRFIQEAPSPSPSPSPSMTT
ncbi:hypothetical protein L7F22_036065 [Adiantum nelumboides]|nr:hypothetical protein [Adiantum nelumboides]